MSQNESHAEIVKRMQNFARLNKSWPCSEDIKAFAVKLDAANRREVTEAATKAATSAVNLTKEKYTRLLAETAKLRDALKLCKSLFDDGTICTHYDSPPEDDDKLTDLKSTVEVALASLNTGSEVKP